MKILILEANPDEDLSLDKEILELRTVIDESIESNRFQVKYGKAVQKDQLHKLMLELEAKDPKDDPIIVHFCGHGTGEQGLVFENDKREKDLVSTQALADCLALFENHVTCVVINACYSDIQAEAINEHIKYVIGMKQSIRDDAAIAFSIGFYRALGFGRSFEDAFKFGKNAIQLTIDDSSKSRNAIAEEMRKLIPIDTVSETVVAQEHLKPALYQPQSRPRKDPHFDDVLRAITRGKIIPFLGSGINLCDRHETINLSNWKPDGQYPPSRSELALYLEEEILGTTLTGNQCPLCDSTGEPLPEGCPIKERNISFTRLLLQHVSQLGKVNMGLGGLNDALNKICRHEYTPNRLHTLLAKLPRSLRQKGYETPILIVTANFDSTLEGALKKEKQPFDLVSYVDSKECFLHQKFRRDDQDPEEKIVSKYEVLITKPNEYKNFDFDAYPVILKLYGLVDGADYQEENFVITEDHFIDYLAQRPIGQMIPASILEKLQQNHIWFLGYGLSNWDERVPLRRIWDNNKQHNRQWWAVQSNPKDLDKSLWRKNDVKLINMSLDDYITNLEQLLKQLQPK